MGILASKPQFERSHGKKLSLARPYTTETVGYRRATKSIPMRSPAAHIGFGGDFGSCFGVMAEVSMIVVSHLAISYHLCH